LYKLDYIAWIFQLVVMIGIRKSLDFVFTRRELKILDDVMPETTKRTEEERRQLEGEVRCVYTLHFNLVCGIKEGKNRQNNT
jgi:hypothetical protein